MDACDAEYNAISYNNEETGVRCFPSANLLMCWFHVEFNVAKHITKKRVPEHLVPTVKADITLICNSYFDSKQTATSNL